jgi:hypothetical protein
MPLLKELRFGLFVVLGVAVLYTVSWCLAHISIALGL